ncbi:MAG: polysaccharide biosynthesis C-terminal domain-containing protein [Acidobacteria bacterium]|nr:polysaccharide biosynthesis C-terminal domain-containing protein [Acidobacteriota bacterium]MBK9529324.1 polysaccharide biosynthesis C-terminal domain-containing protein [Acidobacteriota bacterium]
MLFINGLGFERLPPPFWLLLPGVLFVGVQQVVAQYFLATGLPLRVALTWLAALLTNILANILVVPTHGAPGGAVVSTVCYIAVSIVMFAFFTKTTGRRITDLITPNPSDLQKLWSTIRKDRGGEN